MYDINAHPYRVAPDQINATAGVVPDPNVALGYMKFAQDQEAQKQHQHDQIEQAKQHQLNAKLEKIGNVIDPIEQPDIAKKTNDYANLVKEVYGKSKNGNLSIDDQLKLNMGLAALNGDIAASNQRLKEKTHYDFEIAHNSDKYYPEELRRWKEATNKSYVNGGGSPSDFAPSPALDLPAMFDKQYGQRLYTAGKATQTPTGIDRYGNQTYNYTYDNTPEFEEAKKVFAQQFPVINSLKKAIEYGGTNDKGIVDDTYLANYREEGTGKYNYGKKLDELLYNVVPRNKPEAKHPQSASASGGAGSPNAPKAVVTERDNSTEVYTPLTKVETISVGDKQYNVNAVHSEFDKQGNIIGGYAIDSDIAAENNKNKRQLQVEQNKLNIELAKIKKEHQKDRQKEIDYGGSKMEINKRTSETDNAYTKLYNDIEHRREILVAQYPTDLEEKIDLPQQQVIELQSGKLGVHPEKVASGEAKNKVKIVVNNERTVDNKNSGGAKENVTLPKSYKIKGKDYSADKVEAKAKASGMTVSEYITELEK